jgi:8-oxo-dGTP diphosphatase
MSGQVDDHAKPHPRNPAPTVDIIIEYEGGIVLIERANPPHGWALPGGFIDYGESAERAAVREAREETGLVLDDLEQFHVYSDPRRDCRMHTITTVFTAKGSGVLEGADDARTARVFRADELPEEMAFDHRGILRDYLNDRWGRGR